MVRDFTVAGDTEEINGKEVINMPFGDRTGPMGLGPMTGRGAGFCAGFGRPGFASPMAGYTYPYGYAHLAPVWSRWGRGFGRGRGRGFGRGWWRMGAYGYHWQ